MFYIFLPHASDFYFVSGTGKTMVMDMFYSYVETEKKKRVHFHGFMLDVHKSEFPPCFSKDAKCQKGNSFHC